MSGDDQELPFHTCKTQPHQTCSHILKILHIFTARGGTSVEPVAGRTGHNKYAVELHWSFVYNTAKMVGESTHSVILALLAEISVLSLSRLIHNINRRVASRKGLFSGVYPRCWAIFSRWDIMALSENTETHKVEHEGIISGIVLRGTTDTP